MTIKLKRCVDCYYISQIKNKVATCEFPLPRWVQNGALGGNFIDSYNESNCACYKDKDKVK